MKRCSKCGLNKETKKFSKDNKKDGFQSYCKDCSNAYRKTYIILPSTKVTRNHWYRKNKDRLIKKINTRNRERDFGLYFKYWSMIRRCKYSSQPKYKYYGGKGITVEWKSYKDFKLDMYKNYLEHLKKYGKRNTTLDRVNSGKNYCFENCKWATYKEQNSHLIRNFT